MGPPSAGEASGQAQASAGWSGGGGVPHTHREVHTDTWIPGQGRVLAAGPGRGCLTVRPRARDTKAHPHEWQVQPPQPPPQQRPHLGPELSMSTGLQPLQPLTTAARPCDPSEPDGAAGAGAVPSATCRGRPGPHGPGPQQRKAQGKGVMGTAQLRPIGRGGSGSPQPPPPAGGQPHPGIDEVNT